MSFQYVGFQQVAQWPLTPSALTCVQDVQHMDQLGAKRDSGKCGLEKFHHNEDLPITISKAALQRTFVMMKYSTLSPAQLTLPVPES